MKGGFAISPQIPITNRTLGEVTRKQGAYREVSSAGHENRTLGPVSALPKAEELVAMEFLTWGHITYLTKMGFSVA